METKTIFFSSLDSILNGRSLLKQGNTVDPHSTYIQNYVQVCNYVSSVNKSELPVLRKAPAHWDEYQKSLIDAKAASIKWVNEIAANLKELPTELMDSNEDVLDLFQKAIDHCDKLIIDPTDEFARKKLKQDINNSLEEIHDLSQKIERVIQRMSEFRDTLPQQAANLQHIADLAMQDEKVDKDKIEELQKKIGEIKSEISSLTGAIVGLSIALGASIILSVVAVAVAGPIGMLTWIFTGAAAAVATTYIVIDSIKLNTLKQEVKALQHDMDDYTADVATLQVVAKTFQELAEQAIAVEDNMKYILDIWKALDYDLTQISKEIEKSGEKYSSQDWAGVKTGFQNATTLWKQFQEEVKLCSLEEMSGNTAKLDIGMSSEEVKQQLDAGKNVELIEYLTA
ncbi:hypothetical protein [uncultured Acetobacteroides sp.]|uniref:hypothetical protein n=1 Tax=uncultured Acetobacteroides sp. TaxID=1760811 RepID=UPI0029F48F82|nr:hypothetical protein [uncultured Acetobacteroides sp.]